MKNSSGLNNIQGREAALHDAAPIILTDGKAIVLDLSTGSHLRGEAIANLGIERLGRLLDEAMAKGHSVCAGQQIATVGSPPQNGNWPPHLHVQIILDLLDLGAELPGVARKSQQDYWLGLSPSPAALFPECKAQELEYSQWS